ncbi:hypothetical protein HanIR_Chr11g0513011 [Helianthus annuus]|nr:hypothetical protein HanIR_Chr11g0513011 [Helianthus annuus]
MHRFASFLLNPMFRSFFLAFGPNMSNLTISSIKLSVLFSFRNSMLVWIFYARRSELNGLCCFSVFFIRVVGVTGFGKWRWSSVFLG